MSFSLSIRVFAELLCIRRYAATRCKSENRKRFVATACEKLSQCPAWLGGPSAVNVLYSVTEKAGSRQSTTIYSPVVDARIYLMMMQGTHFCFLTDMNRATGKSIYVEVLEIVR